MRSIARFLWLEKAIDFCDAYHHSNLRIEKELDGRYHVYDMEGGEA